MRDPLPGSTFDFPLQATTVLHGWLKEALQEGSRVNRADPAYTMADTMMRYVDGDHDVQVKPPEKGYPPNTINLFRRAIRTHTSAVTDLRPAFSFRSQNPDFDLQAVALNRYAVAWYLNTNQDLEHADVVRYALTCGSGDLLTEFDPHYLGGETRTFARDPRATYPLWAESARNPQEWEGVTLAEPHSINKLLARFPGRFDAIKPDSGLLAGGKPRISRGFVDALAAEGLGVLDFNDRAKGAATKTLSAEVRCTLYRSFIKDRAINGLSVPIAVGPGAWSRLVKPGERLYGDGGRMILWTEHGVLWDGPNPYWHEMFPISRLQLDPYPWRFLGSPLGSDLKGIQDTINRLVTLLVWNLGQHVEPGMIFDRNVPDSMMARIDPRIPHWTLKRSTMVGTGVQQQAPNSAPPWAMLLLEKAFQLFDQQAGMANLQAFMQLRQMPGRDTIEKYLEALTPELRLEARQIDPFLRSVATMFKGNLFQFQNTAKRVIAIGKLGEVLRGPDGQELDLRWEGATNMIPGMVAGQPGYVPDFDTGVPYEQRGRAFLRQFHFHIQPGSILALQATERKMQYTQWFRLGLIDPWTFAEVVELEGFGEPPNLPLPVLDWKPNPNIPLDQQQPPMEVRKPVTIMEKLLAAQQLGIGASVNPAGRKAAGENAPHAETKGDGRQVISEG